EQLRLPLLNDGRIDVGELLDQLYARGVRSLLLEGGSTLAASFVTAGLVDRVLAYVAPALLGSSGVPVLANLGLTSIEDILRLKIQDVTMLGDDVRIEMRT
ncbi:RibD family protein, partial [Catenulispora sp. NL8]